jgi:hypothetical protein
MAAIIYGIAIININILNIRNPLNNKLRNPNKITKEVKYKI